MVKISRSVSRTFFIVGVSIYGVSPTSCLDLSISIAKTTASHNAAAQDNIAYLNDQVAENIDRVYRKGPQGLFPIHYAACHNWPSVIELFYQKNTPLLPCSVEVLSFYYRENLQENLL